MILYSLLLSTTSIGQEQFDHILYKKSCNASYILALESDDYKGSIQNLKSVNKTFGVLFGEEYILMAYNYTKLGKKRKAAIALKYAWSNYFFDKSVIWESDCLAPNVIMEELNKRHLRFIQQGYENFSKLKTPFSDSIVGVLLVLDSVDQAVRNMHVEDSLEYFRGILRTDSTNLRRFQELIREVGYPGERIIPGAGSSANTLLIHSSYYMWFYEEMKEELLIQVRQGNMAPSSYLLWLDRHKYHFYKNTEFGVLDVPEKGAYTCKEKEDIRAKRLEYGLVYHYPIPSKILQFN